MSFDMNKSLSSKAPDFFKSKWFRNLIIFIFVISCLFFLGQRLLTNWQEIKIAISDIRTSYLWIALIVMAASFLLRPVGFYIFLRVSSSKVSYFQNFRAMFISQLAKYLPGGIWVYPSRVILFTQSGVDAGTSSLGLIFESITLVLSSIIAGSFLLLQRSKPIPWLSGIQMIILISSCSIGVAFILFPQLFERLFPKLFHKLPYLIEFNKLGVKKRLVALVSSVIIFVILWSLSGVSFYFLIKGLDPTVEIDVLTSIGVFSISWLGGFISIFNPGGIGIRETIIVLLLGIYAAEPLPLLVSIISRILWSLLELVFFFAAWLLNILLRDR